MPEKLRWGIIGTGAIAQKFARGLAASQTGELIAIGSRSPEQADLFAKSFPAIHRGDYEAVLANPDVDVVYISTPHPMHAEWSIKAAESKKHVLCEKPLTVNHAEAVAVIESARTNNVFLMEAFMYRCHPQTTRLIELIREGAIGNVRLIEAIFFRFWPAGISADVSSATTSAAAAFSTSDVIVHRWRDSLRARSADNLLWTQSK